MKIKMKKMKTLPLKAMERIFKEAGAERIGKKARIRLKEFLEEKGKRIAGLALRNARHSGRKEIKGEDVEEAIMRIG